MNSKDFKPGHILWATHRELKKGYHPIVYLDGYTDRDFIGAMLTHYEDQNLNVKMNSEFF